MLLDSISFGDGGCHTWADRIENQKSIEILLAPTIEIAPSLSPRNECVADGEKYADCPHTI